MCHKNKTGDLQEVTNISHMK